jgi:aryl-phospho-beta-D-glucosidase BglC (GH1 family)
MLCCTVRERILVTFSGTLLVASCITPPEAKSGTQKSGRAAVKVSADPGPRAFSRPASELASVVKVGWNLGNSLDVPDGETAWGNPKATPELLQGVANGGFGLVRIPVTWTPRTGPAPDYVIDATWLARVEQVVGYARAAGLYAIINIHHDGADGFKGAEWLTLNDENGNTTPENDALVRARFVAVWQQIAGHFKDHGEELLFESMNEIHDGYGPPNPRHIAFINELNQDFVNLVRQSGGSNAERHLVVPGYNTNVDHTLAGFEAPSDSVPNRLMLSVHYYDPYLFTLMAEKHTWGTNSPGRDDWGQEDFVVAQFDKLRAKFPSLPILIGEYGATHQDDYEDYQRYYVEYVTKAAVDRGMIPVIWDNGGRGSGSEKFALLDRNDGEAVYPYLLEAIVRAATGSYALSEVKRPAP